MTSLFCAWKTAQYWQWQAHWFARRLVCQARGHRWEPWQTLAVPGWRYRCCSFCDVCEGEHDGVVIGRTRS